MKTHYHLWVLASCCILSLLRPAPARATNGHQLSAIGAYQQGMGGAVTAAPYDSSTAITNPAGMAMIGTRADFSFEAFMPKRTLTFEGAEEVKSGSEIYLVPSVGWTAPTNDQNDVFFGGGMFVVSGMGVDYETTKAPFLEAPLAMGGFGWDAGSSKADIYSQYQFWKMAPTLAWKSGGFAMGISLNLDYQALSFKNMYSGTVTSGPTTTAMRFGMDLSEMQGAYGYGGSIGFIYQPAPEFAFGASYTSLQKFTRFKWRLTEGDIDFMGMPKNQDGIYTMGLDFPQQAAFGIAVRLGRPVLWTADVKWINYSRTYDVVKLKGAFSDGSTEFPLEFGWDDVWVYATGLQIDFSPNFAFRLGYNQSTSPIKENVPGAVESNLAFPAIVTRHVSGGFTYRFGRNWEMTAAYMKAFKEEMTGATMTKISIEEQAGDLELSYRF